jgi:hypothetical protein
VKGTFHNQYTFLYILRFHRQLDIICELSKIVSLCLHFRTCTLRNVFYLRRWTLVEYSVDDDVPIELFIHIEYFVIILLNLYKYIGLNIGLFYASPFPTTGAPKCSCLTIPLIQHSNCTHEWYTPSNLNTIMLAATSTKLLTTSATAIAHCAQ